MNLRSRAAAGIALGLLTSLLVALAPGTVVTSVTATARAQSGVTSLSAPFVQPGRRKASSARANLSGTVRFTPARTRRPVVIQRRVGTGKWQRVARKRQNRAGLVSFTGRAYAAGGVAYTYRGVATRWKGLRKVAATEMSADGWTTAFRDEFSGRGLSAQWQDRVSNAPSRKCSTVGDPRASDVRRGTLRLRVMLDPQKRSRTCRIRRGPDKGRYRHYLNGQVSTQHLAELGAFTHGTFAARIKFQRKQGQHGAFWLQAIGGAKRSSAATSGAEIDVAEFFGQGYPKGGLASFLYNYGVTRKGKPVKIGGLAPRATRMLPRRDAWWKSYHVFSVEWTKKAYTFRVDGRTHFRTRRGVSGIDEYLVLSMLSSDWELKRAKRRGIKPGGTMQVDWVRVWQQQ